MTSIGAYLIGGTGIRLRQGKVTNIKWIDSKQNNGKLTHAHLQKRIEDVFKLANGRLKSVCIVNANLSDYESLKIAADVADQHADKVEVITTMLARVTNALYELATRRRHSFDKVEDVIMVLTVTQFFCEFSMLIRGEDGKLNITHNYLRENRNDCLEIFPDITRDFCPDATIILHDDESTDVVRDLEHRYRPYSLQIKKYKRWDHMLLDGALYRAMDESDGFDPRFRIPNFANGIVATITQRGSCVHEEIMADRTPLPCNVYGFEGQPQPFNIVYCPIHFQVYNELLREKRNATDKTFQSTGSSSQIIAHIDKRGVPTIFTNPQEADKFFNKLNTNNPVKNGSSEPSDSTSKPFQNGNNSTKRNISSGNKEAFTTPRVIMKFRDDACAVEVVKNGTNMLIRNDLGYEWTPLYLSMAEGAVEVGEKARIHRKDFPQSVIYDVLKIIGHPLSGLKHKPHWGFNLLEQDDGSFLFEIETPAGPKRIPQHLVLSAFLKVLKIRAELNLEYEIKEITIQTPFELTKPQEDVFIKAATKLGLTISAFTI